MAQIILRIDDDIKRSAEAVCAEIGMSMSTAITIYLKKLGRERRIPFEVNADPFYSPQNIRYLETIADDIRKGNAVFKEHKLIEVD